MGNQEKMEKIRKKIAAKAPQKGRPKRKAAQKAWQKIQEMTDAEKQMDRSIGV